MKSVSSRSMIRCLRTTRSARARPDSVSSASLRAPRSIRPSASRRFSISPAEARETPSIWATREASGGEPGPFGVYSPIATASDARHWGRFSWLAALGVAGFTLGLMALVHYSEWMKGRAARRVTSLVGPGAAAIDEFDGRTWLERLTPGKQLALLIAIGIGVHNFGEGRATGQAAAANSVSLAVTLIIGFSLHNATEGFGICGPMRGEGTRPS